jgi:hypothetical protein
LSRHNLLRGSVETAGSLGALAHHLDCGHDILRLVVVRITQRGRPGKILVHVPENSGESGQSLDTFIPGLLVGCLSQRGALQSRIGLQPPVRFDNLLGKGAGREDLRDQRVRVERNGRHELLQLFGRLLHMRGRGAGGRRLLLCCHEPRQSKPGNEYE